MEDLTIHTDKCTLRQINLQDAGWLNELFNNIKHIDTLEGLKMFSTSIRATESFILNFIESAKRNEGVLWSINMNDRPIGFISVYDVKDKPFFTYGLFPDYRRQGFFHGVIDRCNRFVESIQIDKIIIL